MPEPIEIAVDHAQRRVYPSAVTVALRGRELYDPAQSSNVFAEPVRDTLMLKPRQLDPEWWTSNAGDYAKLTIASGYEVKTSGKWVEPEVFPGAGKFLQCDNASGEYARTSATPGLNRGMSLSYFGYAVGDRAKLLEFGWSDSTTPTAATASTGIIVWTDGLFDVYRAGSLVGSYSVSGAGGRSLQNEMVSLIILPCRRRELLVFSTAGDGFAHVFDDIDEGEESPVIVAAERFFVIPGTGQNLQIQFCPLRFPESGTLCSGRYQFAKAPRSTQELFEDWYNPVFTSISNASLYGDKAYAGTTDVSTVEIRNGANSAAFTPDDDETALRLRLTLTGDGDYSPFLYGSVVEYAGEIVETDDSQRYVLNGHVMAAALTVPDDPLGATFTVTARQIAESFENTGTEEDPVYEDIETDLLENVSAFEAQSFRPLEVLSEGVQIFNGYTMRPRFEDSERDRTKMYVVEAYDIARALELCIFRSRVPMDGWPLCLPVEVGTSAVSYVLARAGIDLDRCTLSDLDFIIGEVPSEAGGEWNVAAEEGDTAAEVLQKLHRLAADCVYGSHPTPDGMGFWFRSPEDMEDDVPVLTLYRTVEDAMDANPELTEEEALNLLYSEFREETLTIEANEIRATGVESRTGRLIQSYAVVEDSQDPSIPPDAREEGWAGFELTLGVAAREFKRESDTDKAVEKLLPIATGLARACEWAANTLLLYAMTIGDDLEASLPVWRGDLVHLDGIGDRRVTSLSCVFAGEYEGFDPNRAALYTGGTIRGHGGVTMESIQLATQARASRRIIQDLIKAPLEATGVIAVRRYTP